MKKFLKKTVGFVLATLMAVSSTCCVSVFAVNDEIPAGLPEGAYKVYEGIYAVDNDNGISLLNTFEDVSVAGPAFGTITQPNALSNIIVESGDKYLCITSSEYVRINFVYGNTSIFGASLYDWPAIGTSPTTTYYIETDYYDFQNNVPYKMQITSANSNSYNSVTFCITSSSYLHRW